jgi:aarF domain-containing kinase
VVQKSFNHLTPSDFISLASQGAINPELEENFRLCFIDTGIVGTLNSKDQENLIDLFDAVIKNKGYLVGQLMIERSRFPDSIPLPNRELFCQEMDELVDRVHKTGLASSKIDIGELLSSVLKLCFSYQIKLESRYAVIILAMGIVEGLGRQVDPDVDLLSSAAPFVVKASIDHLTHKYVGDEDDNNNNNKNIGNKGKEQSKK